MQTSSLEPHAVDDGLHVPDPAEPTWTESFGFWTYDATAGLGVWSHLQRVPAAPLLWQALVAFHQPGDNVFVAKVVAPSAGPDSIGPGVLRAGRDSTGPAWRFRHEGAARAVTTAELEGGPLRDGVTVPTGFDLRFEGVAPVWQLRGAGGESWAPTHQEQSGAVSGSITLGGVTQPFTGVGHRDHSWGPRDLAPVPETLWLHGGVGADRAFLALQVGAGAAVQHGYVVRDGELAAAQLMADYPIGIPQAGQRFSLDLSAGGETVHLDCTYLDALPVTGFSPSHQAFGRAGAPGAVLEYWACVVRIDWDGEVGHGFANVSIPVPRRCL